MKQWIAGMALLFSLTAGMAPAAAAVEAEGSDKAVLQKGLTVYEIDQELGRINKKQADLAAQLNETERNITAAGKQSSETRQHAAGVLRAYYMGDRDSLWVLLFTIRSLSDALSVWEYTQMILRSDQLALRNHTEAYQRLKAFQSQLERTQQDLQESKNRYTMERARLASLQQELDRQLAASADGEKLQQQMKELNEQWKNKGIPLFKSYFQALAKAMQQLPDLLSAPVSAAAGSGSASGSKPGGHLIVNGLNYTFQLSDGELNEFLRQKNELFRNITFHFAENQVIASGRQDGLDISIKGSYRMAVKADGKPYIRFQMDELEFNGFTLPQSTVQDLERDVDLGIYPQKIAPFLQATDVKLEENKLSIYLKLAL